MTTITSLPLNAFQPCNKGAKATDLTSTETKYSKQYWREKATDMIDELGWGHLITGNRVDSLANYIRDKANKKD